MDQRLQDKPMFSNRDLIGLIIPLILDALLTIMAGLVDSAMVSANGEVAVSAVSLVDSLSLLFTTVFGAIATGGVVVTSQYIGKRDYEKAHSSAKQLIYASVIISTFVSILLLAFRSQILNLIYGSIDPAVSEGANTYFFYIILGYPFLTVGAACTALLRSMSRNKSSVMITTGINIINVIGNAVLIYGFDMGVKGAAISTSFSRVVFAAIGLYVLHSKNLPIHFEKLHKIRLDFDILKRIANIGVGNGIESSLFHIGKILIASLVSGFGTIAIAANSVATSITNIGWTTLGAFSTTLLPIVGQCMGAGRPDLAKKYSKKLIMWAGAVMVILFGSIFLLRNQLVLLFNFSPEALDEAAYYTGAYSLFTMFSIYSWSFVPVASFRAAGDTKYAVTLSFSTMFTFRVGLSYLLGGYFGMGLMGVVIGMGADWFCRSIINMIHFHRGKWLNKKVI